LLDAWIGWDPASPCRSDPAHSADEGQVSQHIYRQPDAGRAAQEGFAGAGELNEIAVATARKVGLRRPRGDGAWR